MPQDHDMTKPDRILLGVIVNVHGIKGEVIIKSFAAQADDIAAYGPLETSDGARQIELTIVRQTKKGLIARIKCVTDRNAAEALKGTELFVSRARLPETESDAFYFVDLIGLRAIDCDGKTLGTVSAVENHGACYQARVVDVMGARATDTRRKLERGQATAAVPDKRLGVADPTHSVKAGYLTGLVDGPSAGRRAS